jgi:nitrite reductase/ring-hydroxylating ferredoxin subunit
MGVVTEKARWHVGTLARLEEDERLFADVDGREVCVFRTPGGLRAYENHCAHLGGPVCQGKLVPKVTAVLDDVQAVVEERFDRDQMRIACPWHGWEFDLDTGRSVIDRRVRLRRFEVVEDQGEIYVLA